MLASGLGEHAFSIVHIYAHIRWHLSASATTKILESSHGVLMSALYMTAAHLVMKLGQKFIYFIGMQV